MSLVSRSLITSSVEYTLMLPPTLGRHSTNIHNIVSFLSSYTLSCFLLLICLQKTCKRVAYRGAVGVMIICSVSTCILSLHIQLTVFQCMYFEGMDYPCLAWYRLVWHLAQIGSNWSMYPGSMCYIMTEKYKYNLQPLCKISESVLHDSEDLVDLFRCSLKS